MKAVQVALNLGMERRFVVHTPLMFVDKAGTWAMAEALGGQELVRLVLEATHTCYAGDRTAHDWGRGCGSCPACDLRAAGWTRFNSRRIDPTSDMTPKAARPEGKKASAPSIGTGDGSA